MSVWQFQFSLLPVAGLNKIHGQLPRTVPAYARRDPNATLMEDDEFDNYWAGVDLHSALTDPLAQLLPARSSWSGDARMFGDEHGDSIEIWNDDISVALDVSKLNLPLLAAIVDFASQLDCKLVLRDNGRVCHPILQIVLDELRKSIAAGFVSDPQGYFANRAIDCNIKVDVGMLYRSFQRALLFNIPHGVRSISFDSCAKNELEMLVVCDKELDDDARDFLNGAAGEVEGDFAEVAVCHVRLVIDCGVIDDAPRYQHMVFAMAV